MEIFRETNPIAERMMERPAGLVCFKIGGVLLATGVLLIFRRCPSAEVACWSMCAVYVVLGLMWLGYFREARRLRDVTERRARYTLMGELRVAQLLRAGQFVPHRGRLPRRALRIETRSQSHETLQGDTGDSSIAFVDG